MKQTRPTPKIWLLLSDKLGDNSQARLIAQACGLACQEKRILMCDRWIHSKPSFAARIDHIDPDRSDPLEPPWPDAIITVGSRPSMAAFWIKQQSGGTTKIIQIGRAKRHLARFDLLVAGPQYEIAPAPNVFQLDLPLIRADRQKVAAARIAFETKLAGLKRPLTGFLIGGPTRPYTMSGELIVGAFAKLRALGQGGTIFITTSRRTPAKIVAHLKSIQQADTRLFVWHADAKDNPYHGLLAHADRFAVTGDSISMMLEVADLQKPLAILPLPVSRNPAILSLVVARRLLRYLDKRGRFGSPRDLTSVHARLIGAGAAIPLEQGFPKGPFDGLADELARAGERVREIILG